MLPLHSKSFRLTALTLAVLFFCDLCGLGYAQTNVQALPAPGTMVFATADFEPLALKGMIVDPNDPAQFYFVVDEGSKGADGGDLQRQSQILLNYFLTALALPEKKIWVNLSPYESQKIIPSVLGSTQMGETLLAQDYILKQLASSLTCPDTPAGKKYWDEINATPLAALGGRSATNSRGALDAGVRSSFTKVWIVPDHAVIYQDRGRAYIGEAHLKVMMQEDYLAMNKNGVGVDLRVDPKQDNGRTHGSAPTDAFKKYILPSIEKEVNSGKNFAPLRQVYNSLLLALWFKQTLKNSLLGQAYSNRQNVKGVDLAPPQAKEQIYARYLEAFQKGAYSLVRKDHNQLRNKISRRQYFAGGFAVPAGETIIKPRALSDIPRSRSLFRVVSARLKAAGRAMGQRVKPLSDEERSGREEAIEALSAYVDDLRDELMRDVMSGKAQLPVQYRKYVRSYDPDRPVSSHPVMDLATQKAVPYVFSNGLTNGNLDSAYNFFRRSPTVRSYAFASGLFANSREDEDYLRAIMDFALNRRSSYILTMAYSCFLNVPPQAGILPFLRLLEGIKRREGRGTISTSALTAAPTVAAIALSGRVPLVPALAAGVAVSGLAFLAHKKYITLDLMSFYQLLDMVIAGKIHPLAVDWRVLADGADIEEYSRWAMDNLTGGLDTAKLNRLAIYLAAHRENPDDKLTSLQLSRFSQEIDGANAKEASRPDSRAVTNEAKSPHAAGGFKFDTKIMDIQIKGEAFAADTAVPEDFYAALRQGKVNLDVVGIKNIEDAKDFMQNSLNF